MRAACRAAGGRGGRGRAAAADSPAINSPGYMSRSGEHRPQSPGRGPGAPQRSCRPGPGCASRRAGARQLRGHAAPPTCLSPARPRRAGQQLPHIWRGRPQPLPAGSPTCRLPLPQHSPAARTARRGRPPFAAAVPRSLGPIAPPPPGFPGLPGWGRPPGPPGRWAPAIPGAAPRARVRAEDLGKAEGDGQHP